jgi:hypothetical protein
VIAFGFTVCALIAPQMAQAQGAIVGVNAAIGGLSVDQQNAILGELHAAGVHVIRTGITPDDKGVDLARRVLKDIRSHSKLNQHTPIISAGLVYYAWLDSREDFAVYRCSGLTESGRLAIAPIVVTEPTGSNN